MSIRAREKALVLASQFEKDFYTPGLLLARAGGLSFLLLGSLITYAHIDSPLQVDGLCENGASCQSSQLGNVVSTTKTAVKNTTNQVNDVELLSSIPDVLDSSTTITVQTAPNTRIKAYAKYMGTGSGGNIPLQIDPLGNNKQEIVIDKTKLTPNQYELIVYSENPILQKNNSYSLGYFALIETTNELTNVPSEPSDFKDDSLLGQTDLVKDKDDNGQEEDEEENDVLSEGGENVEKETANDGANDDGVDDNDAIDVAAEPVSVTEPPKSTLEFAETDGVSVSEDQQKDTDLVNDPLLSDLDEQEVAEELLNVPSDNSESKKATTDGSKSTSTPANPKVWYISTKNMLSGMASVNVINDAKPAVISFYIRPVQTLNTQSVGQLITGTRTFRFDTEQFPDGRYQLYAESRLSGTVTRSNQISFEINNIARPPVTPVEDDGLERDFLDIAEELQEPEVASVPELDSEQVISSTTSASENSVATSTDSVTPNRLIQDTLLRDKDTIDDLFQRYSVAQQSGDASLIDQSKKEIDAFRQEVVAAALEDDNDQLLASELDSGLQRELNELSNKVQTFEIIRRERSESASAVDTDGDGISDFDETTLYQTDPNLADTDNDGFTDGVEIIRGFNPNDSAVEAATVYQSPKEASGVVKTEKLQVVEVVPQISVDDSVDAPVQAVVKGRALPNSFVTLYIFSTPTIVTVRTEADGSFEYTFTKELEDGQHEVYVALTDNTGSIVAQSEVFTFVKQAQAFTPVDAEASGNTVLTSEVSDSSSPYQIVLGMSIFSLGVLLILLGVGLKSNRPEVVILDDKPA